MLVSTTVVVIIVTVFIQGVTIKPLVRLLKVKTEEHVPKTVIQQVFGHVSLMIWQTKNLSQSGDDIMAGIEAIVGMKGSNYVGYSITYSNLKI